MSGKTITDKRIDIERKKANAVCDHLYETTFYSKTSKGSPPDDEFWHDEAALDAKLAIALKPRPMSIMDVRIAFNAYVVAFKAACRKYGQQARTAD